ncbi:LLM class flavin-dependent oxidoreductase [Amorphoplanes nipponensis]|uniref:Luciferase n=1 Tax=Actinoplanes nipponensis TaxID=135950 RepID=A0A919MY78_9ACTN|nr:LLM class flavin-dependent oxidoreductase [Actinoplanes nipponensis]GIE54215.1 luciferase [Actinoplanes nipponensis]
MTIGIGLPVADIPALLDWARRADAGPFRTLGLLDRLVYDNPEPLVALAAVAGATRRIRVQTEVLLAPLRDTVLLAKQAATLDRVSGGRFTLGLGVGGRPDDYRAAGQDVRRRGHRLDEQMAELGRLWSGEPHCAHAGPVVPGPGRPEILFGAFRPPALRRVARFGDGFLGATPPRYLGRLFRTVEQMWADAGRAGRPRLVAQGNVALGPAAVVEQARAEILRYYGPGEYAAQAAAGLLGTPAAIGGFVAECRDLGADEVMLYCWATDPEQVDRLADLPV